MSFEATTAAANLNQTKDNSAFVLYVWPGEWSLPSLDPECLTALCFLKYANLEHRVVTITNAWKLFKNEYPKLEYKSRFYVGLDEIIECIKKVKNIDVSLNDNNYADMFALLNLFKQKFIPAFNLLCWLDDDNTYTVIRRAYGNCIRFPLSIIKLKQLAARAGNSIISNFRDDHVKLETVKQQITFDAKECLNILSSKLGENLFMFENRPSLLDAYFFGYLSILSQAPFVNSTLKSHFISCLNLEPLTIRIRRELFPTDKKDKQIQRTTGRFERFFKLFSLSRLFSNPSEPTSKTTTKSEFDANEQWQKRKSQLFAVSIAVTAMIAYAFAVGLIRIDIVKTDVEYIEKS